MSADPQTNLVGTSEGDLAGRAASAEASGDLNSPPEDQPEADEGGPAGSPASLMDTVRQLWPFIRPQRRRLALASAISLCLTAAEVAMPVLVGLFLDSLLARLHGTTIVAPFNGAFLLGSLAGLAVLRGLLVWRFRTLSGQIGERVAARLRDVLWKHLQVLPLDYSRRRGTGRLLLRFISDTRAVQRLVTDGFVRLSQEVLLAVGVLTALIAIDWRMGMMVALIVPIYGVIFLRLNPELQRASRATRRRRSRLSAYLQERIAGLAIVKALVGQQAEATSVAQLNKDLANRAARRAAVDGQLQGITTFIVGALGVLVLVLASREVTAGRLTGGSLVAFYTLLGFLLPVFRRVVTANRYLQEGHISVERLMDTLATRPEGASRPPGPDLAVTRGQVTVVGAAYDLNDGRPILHDVSFHAQRGEIVLILGANGTGKTTLMELLMRFREPSRGGVYIDGRDIAQVSLASLRRQVGMVGNDWPIFDGTVFENIAYGLEGEPSPEHLQRALRLAGAEAFIASLPDGLDTRVGRGGSRLSTGQRQLLALARALAMDPPILLLDDALSGLDTEAEATLMDSLREFAKEKTLILTAHRLPPRLRPNRIYRLQDGRLTQIEQKSVLPP